MEMDQYQIDHAKNFKYRYYPPKLVELAQQENENDHASMSHHNQNHRAAYPNMGYSYQRTTPSAHPAQRSNLIWYIIIIIIMLASFLIIGILTMHARNSNVP